MFHFASRRPVRATPRPIPRDDSAPDARLQDATFGLAAWYPELSAATGANVWQRSVICVLAAGLAGSWGLELDIAATGVAAVLMSTFLCIVAVRGLVLWSVAHPRSSGPQGSARVLDCVLPSYTVLVPLYRETDVVPQLVRGLAALDYPADKLQILLICEEHDRLTQATLRRATLSKQMHIVVVPDGQPRTKPRALNYALSEATGEYVVVFDAEDEPEPDQLRKAVAAFQTGPANLGCLQGQLKIYNASDSWLTRQFAIEYAALFGLVLPALERFGFPITLGGTSNHFPRRALLEVGGWDPFNVTEDADLGLRLARQGWHVGVLQSATWEEAPPSYRAWHNQRVRWLKGWLQTAIVVTRQPLRLWRELGAIRVAAVLVTLASMLLSAFVHPVYVAAIVCSIASSVAAGVPLDTSGWWWSGLFVFAAGYAVSLRVAWLAARASGHTGLHWHVVLIPVYWMLISAAAYAALYQYFTRPFHWNKTPHRGRLADAAPSAEMHTGVGSGAPIEEVANQL